MSSNIFEAFAFAIDQQKAERLKIISACDLSVRVDSSFINWINAKIIS